MTQVEAKALIRALIVGLPSVRFPAESVEFYERAIADLDVAIAQQAVEELIQTWTHARVPPVGEIRQAAGRLSTQRAGMLPIQTVPRHASMPTAAEWAPTLTRLLEADSRHRKMERYWRKRWALREPVELPCPFLEIARRGARGENVQLRIEDLLGASSPRAHRGGAR